MWNRLSPIAVAAVFLACTAPLAAQIAPATPPAATKTLTLECRCVQTTSEDGCVGGETIFFDLDKGTGRYTDPTFALFNKPTLSDPFPATVTTESITFDRGTPSHVSRLVISRLDGTYVAQYGEDTEQGVCAKSEGGKF